MEVSNEETTGQTLPYIGCKWVMIPGELSRTVFSDVCMDIWMLMFETPDGFWAKLFRNNILTFQI